MNNYTALLHNHEYGVREIQITTINKQVAYQLLKEYLMKNWKWGYVNNTLKINLEKSLPIEQQLDYLSNNNLSPLTINII